MLNWVFISHVKEGNCTRKSPSVKTVKQTNTLSQYAVRMMSLMCLSCGVVWCANGTAMTVDNSCTCLLMCSCF
jgi:hypothetical protein